MTNIQTSDIVTIQIPDHFREDGPTLVAFIKAYYEWLDNSPYGNDIELIQLSDIDATVDEFLLYFKESYLPNFPNLSPDRIRLFVKNIGSFYNTRGTEESFKLLFRLLYGIESKIYVPGNDILKASDGKWVNPSYIETTTVLDPAKYMNKTITGSISGSTGVVENVIRKSINGKFFSVIFVSNIRGLFVAGEQVTVDGNLDNTPIVLGSLNEIDVIEGGQENAIGDIFDVSSIIGRYAKARVTGIENGTGRVDFRLNDGGSGYSMQAEAIVSEKIYTLTTPTTESFIIMEGVHQVSSNIAFLSANNDFTVGDVVTGYTSGTNVFQGEGVIVSLTQAGANGTMKVVHSDSFAEFKFADTIATAGNTVSAIIDLVDDTTATANVAGFTTQSVGVYNTNNVFYLGHTITGDTSGASGIIASQSTGQGANFSVGSLTGEETVWVNTDEIGGLNGQGVPYLTIRLNGQGSGVGVVSSLIVTDGGTGGQANGTAIPFVGGGDGITGISIEAPGSGYANGERLVFTSAFGSGATGIITTNGAGAIVSSTIGKSGSGYAELPSITVDTTAGTGAVLTGISTPTAAATGTITTDGAGVVTSATVTSGGEGYFGQPTITFDDVIITPVMQYGYGFPKYPSGGLNTIINKMLSANSVTIGSIASLAQISPGQGYNQDPFVLVVEPMISALDKRDLFVSLSNVVSSFSIGEMVEQNVIDPANELQFTIDAGPGFEIGEIVTQGTTTGIVYYREPGMIRLYDVVNGPFAPGPITANITETEATITSVLITSRLGVAKGRVVEYDFDKSTLVLSRMSFNTAFNTVQPIQGLRSGATANVVNVKQVEQGLAMGNNAIVTATVKTANGIVTSLEVIDSGFGYSQDAIVELTRPESPYVVTGVASVTNQGTAEGYWTNTDGFLDSDKYIQDGNYYQNYSYEIQVGISMDRYADIIKKLLHTAGTKMFGRYVLITSGEIDIDTTREYIDGAGNIVP